MRLIKYSIILYLALSLSAYARQTTHLPDLQSKPAHTTRIATYNLFWKNGKCGPRQFNHTMHLIKIINADIILLQETTKSWKKCINRNLPKIYPYQGYRHHVKAGGLSVLSKYPFESKKYIHSKNHLKYPAWLITVNTKHGKIDILNLHLRPSVNDNNKIGFMGAELFKGPNDRAHEMQYLHQSISIHKPTIIAGDFNEGYGGATQMLKYNGWYDAFSQRHKNTHTWRWKVGPFTIKQQFDRIFFSPHFRIINTQVLHEGESDHYPVIVDFRYYHN